MKITLKDGSKLVAGVALASGVAAAMFACGSREPQFAPTPGPDAGFMPQPPPPPMVDAGPPAPVAAMPCDAVQSAALATSFNLRAPTEAPNMKPEGGPVCGVVPVGGTFVGQTMMLEPGYCYTVVGGGLGTATDVGLSLDVDMTAVPPMFQAAMQQMFAGKPLQVAVSNTNGPLATIGPKNDCFQWSNPLNMPAMVKVAIQARAGSGPVGAQVYKRKKY